MCVLKVFHSHGLNDVVLKDIYRSVVLAKLLYASLAWWGLPQPLTNIALKLLSNVVFVCSYTVPKIQLLPD